MTRAIKLEISDTDKPHSTQQFWLAKLRSPGFLSFVLALLTFLVFLPVLSHDFVNYDDPDYVTSNRHVQTGLTWENIVWAFTGGHASNWHPLTWLSHMLDCQLFGQHAGAHHFINLCFHILNTLLLFLLLRRLTSALWRSWLVAALFGLHPLHVESVAWISERKDVLSAFFWMLTMYAYVRYAQSKAEEEGSRGEGRGAKSPHAPRFYALTLLFFSLGLMSKPMLVTLPFVLLLLDYWPLGRLKISWLNEEESTAEASRRAPVGQPKIASAPSALIVEKLPFFALSVISSYITFIVQQKGGAVSTSVSMGARLANALVSYARYIGKMFWPQKLSVLYPHPGHWPVWQVTLAAGLLILISAGVFVFGRRRPYLIVGWLWFVGTLIPVIGLIQVGVQSMADRYTYIPIIGLFIALVWGAGDLVLAQRKPPAEVQDLSSFGVRAAGFIVVVALLACGILTVTQTRFWRNSETLFAHAVQVTRDNYLAYNNLGYYLWNKGKTAEAVENYHQSLKINPSYEDALNNLGFALAGQKKYTEAIPYYEAALRISPRQVEVHNNLGNALSELGRIDEAIAHYRIVLEQKPDHADAHNNLGIALAMRGKFDEAIGHFHEAIRYKPNYASAHSNLGNALAVQHKIPEAIAEYKESLRLKPDDAQAHNNLGNALAEQGLLAESIPHYERALALNADNPEAHFNLGILLARQQRRAEAIAHFNAALQLKPDYAEAKRQLEAISTPEQK